MRKPLIGITMGDPAGIGPEIIIKALNKKAIYDKCNPLVIGSSDIMQQANKIAGADLRINSIDKIEKGIYRHGFLDVYEHSLCKTGEFEFGKVSAECGRAAFESIKKTIEFAINKEIDATVTAPINKESINLAGFHYAGHTEIYAHFTGTKDYTMMLAGEGLMVVHVSTHVSMMEACKKVKKERVYNVICLADKVLKKMGFVNPRIAVAGLNPHAGENGMFGREEIEEITPAIEKALSEGINVTGPLPADTVFSKARGGQFDMVVCMYHDQGHIPLKLIGFVFDQEKNKWLDVSGVNITLGLPIIRCSVDHGTAFGKAGKGTANETSMINAIDYAIKLGGNND